MRVSKCAGGGMEKIKWSEKVSNIGNEEVLQSIGELRKYFFIHDTNVSLANIRGQGEKLSA